MNVLIVDDEASQPSILSGYVKKKRHSVYEADSVAHAMERFAESPVDATLTDFQNFWRARYYEVLTLMNGTVTNRKHRAKAGHHTFAGEEQQHEHHGPGHGFDQQSQGKHRTMTGNVLDCQVLVARGIGFGAYQHITDAKIKPIITLTQKIDDAGREIISGTIVNHEERLH